MVPALVKAWQDAGTEVAFDLSAEGSSSAFRALLGGTCDLGMSARVASEDEIARFREGGMMLFSHPAAEDLVVVIVNPANETGNLTSAQLGAIFSGEITNWSKLGGADEPIRIFTPAFRVLREDFRNRFMEGREFVAESPRLTSSKALRAQVARHVGGIAFLSLRQVGQGEVKPVALDGVAPVPGNRDIYPFTRTLFYSPSVSPEKTSGRS